MKASAKTYMTTGVALVGAGVIAASPIAPAPANVAEESRSHEVRLMAAAEPTNTQREIDAALALLESFEPGGVLNSFIGGTLEAFSRPGPVPYTAVSGPLDGVGRIGQGIAASGLRLGAATLLSPLRLVELAAAIVEGNGAEGFASLVENIVDAPLWVVDPALYGLRDALPAPLGGPDGIIENFRDELWKVTEEINAGLQDPGAALQGFIERTMNAFQRPGPVAYTPVSGPIDGLSRIAEGVVATALRLAAATVLAPVGVVQAAAALAQGDTAEALDLVENIVDGPLWVADPALYGLRDALPAPLGGPNAFVENFRNGLWGVTEQINAALRGAFEPQTPAADEDALIGTEEFDGPSIDSLPDRQARFVGLSEQRRQQEPEHEEDAGQDEELQQDVQQPDTTGATDDPVSKEQEEQPPAHNVVRESPNFSPNAGQSGDKDPTGGAADEVVTTTEQVVTAPATVATGDNAPADNAPADKAEGSEKGDSESGDE
ncbi:hypothetical protein [Mycobacterium sp. IS-3022]|uniref:hypothetical protein n=1 Tax=Mycobacterium sp. IS-3022 TaxID=1772277 RepID=UPI0007417F52|nr:hypothetical protein [Mycobacterium sp. IS-3022]KUH92792.1 hypothetical protein AU188_14345 [Mycobacterium sp. IS-3022]